MPPGRQASLCGCRSQARINREGWCQEGHPTVKNPRQNQYGRSHNGKISGGGSSLTATPNRNERKLRRRREKAKKILILRGCVVSLRKWGVYLRYVGYSPSLVCGRPLALGGSCLGQEVLPDTCATAISDVSVCT